MRQKSGRTSDIPKRGPVITRKLADELLVYNPKTARAYNLNAIAGEIWQLCDGSRNVDEIFHAMAMSAVPVDKKAVWIALHRFSKAGLLASPLVDLQRRRFFKASAIATTSLAVPMIASVLVPKAEAAVSCSTLGQACGPRPCCGLLVCVAHLCA
jgi:hypothetical protein